MLNCFLSQTHPEKHLLIVVEKGEAIEDLAPCDPRVAIVYSPRGLTLGAKRNYACEAATGELIAHFDDDDWSAPGRLADQVRILEETGLAMTGYRLMKFTDGKHWWRYNGSPDYALGTSLCYRKAWWKANRYPPIPIASDSKVVYAAQAQKQLAVADPRDLMVASVHPAKTNRLSMTGPSWKALPASEAIAPAWLS
jgi:glycosyltransferase involved in cell wall biosynthesis